MYLRCISGQDKAVFVWHVTRKVHTDKRQRKQSELPGREASREQNGRAG